MRKLYKYLPNNFDLASHLKNPELKLSLIKTLNDPYEGQMTKNAIEKLSKAMIKHSDSLVSVRDNADVAKATAINAIQYIVKTICITSFSETQRNLLMWTHYSAQHKGICIGYDTNMLNRGEGPHHLRKVNYDSILFEQEQLDELDTMEDFDSIETEMFIERLLTTKSDDWSYEKEHRYISPPESCTRAIIPHSFEELHPDAKYAIMLAEGKESHKVIKHQSSVELIPSRSDEELMTLLESSNEIETTIAYHHEPIFLKKINKKYIKSIYLGVFFDEKETINIIDLINKDPELQHIKVYKNYISDERYELKHEIIYPK
ncbi:DUF2971 domain-containing protein [Aeromonas sp. 6P]|uniref:DUF2971 domain-containing protein n=1 Tax=Aeromonas sp. 6P TaxID=3452722 RepID=UPI003F7A93B0